MKNYLLLITCSLFCSLQSFAQTNLGFETWVNQGAFYDPKDWTTTNVFTALGGPVSCVRSEPHWGTYSLGIAPSSLFGSPIPGFALQQSYYTKRPKSVSLYYKYNSKAGDSAGFSIEFSKGPTNDPSNPIGTAEIMLPAAKNWTLVKSDIAWTSGINPDSLVIFISNAPDNTTDTLLVDDIGISMFGLAVEQPQKPIFNIFLTSNNYLMMDPALMNENSRIIIRNMLGQVVLEQTANTAAIDLNNMMNGTYAYEIISNNNTPVSGKFVR